MDSSITARFKRKPTRYYAMTVAASWAGVGALMNSITITTENGLIPSIIWGLGNTFACILFGLIACKLPTLRTLMRTRAMKYIIGIMSIFQLWTNMNGIQEIFGDTMIGTMGGTIIVYVVCIGFIILLLKFGMIRNILTDSASWIIVYGIVAVLTLLAFIQSRGALNSVSLGLEWSNLSVGLRKGFLLLPGPFTYPYFYELLDYNDSNADEAKSVNIRKSFCMGGLMFGVYMVFTYALAFVQFSAGLNLLKAILISIVGISSISTFIFSEYIVFGRKIGLAVDGFTVLFWPVMMGLGVMGVWTLMANIRIYLIAVLLIIALIMRIRKRRKEAIQK